MREFRGARQHAYLEGKPMLLMANKQDLPQSAAPVEVAEALELHLLSDAAYHIVGGCAKCGGTVGEPLLGGLAEPSEDVRLHTLMAMLALAPRLSDANLNDKLLRATKRLEGEQSAKLRANVIVFYGRLADKVHAGSSARCASCASPRRSPR